MADHLDQIAAAVHLDSRLSGVTSDVGRLEDEALGTYPRIVWVSEEGAIGPPKDIGPTATSAGVWQRAAHTDLMDVRATIHGQDREAARLLMHALIASARDAGIGSIYFGRYRWISQQDARGEYAFDGEAIELQMTWHLPVYDETDTITVISAQEQTATYIDNATGDSIEGICET